MPRETLPHSCTMVAPSPGSDTTERTPSGEGGGRGRGDDAILSASGISWSSGISGIGGGIGMSPIARRLPCSKLRVASEALLSETLDPAQKALQMKESLATEVTTHATRS